MSQFVKHKKRFTGHEDDDEVFTIELPDMLGQVDHDAVDERDLNLVRWDWKQFEL